MKQLQADELRRYHDLLEQYHASLDLLSPAGLRELAVLSNEALLYPTLLEPPPSAGSSWLDLGSGAGLPAIPLAIGYPQLRFTLVERRRRRVAFLRLCTARLALTNTSIVAADVRDYQADHAYSLISAQAVGSFATVYALTRHLHAAVVTLIARKGDDWRGELSELEEQLGCRARSSRERALPRHGRLVAVTITGGLPCPPSA